MKRSNLIRLALTLLLGATALVATAQQSLEIIPLKHRTVDQVLPVLRPLLEPGGTLAGQNNQLIVRANPANLAELRAVLEAIDRPARRLQISVRFDDSLDAARQGIGASGTIGNRGSSVELRAQDSRLRAEERVDQRLQVIEGARATIYTGQSRPLRQRQLIQTPAGVISQETIVVQERATGFDVVPRLSGENVTVEIAPQRESGDSFQRVSTTASGRLGEWFEIGGVAGTASRDERGLASSNFSSGAESRRVWLKVEELR